MTPTGRNCALHFDVGAKLVGASSYLAASCLASLLTVGLSFAAASDTLVSFSSAPQSLVGPAAAQPPLVSPLDFGVIGIKDQHIGEIRRIDVTGISNAAAVDAWENALAICMGRSVLGISPSASQCTTGTVNVPLVGAVPIPGVPTGGLGPRPSDTINKPFDVGFRFDYSAYIHPKLEIVQTVRNNSVGTLGFDTHAQIIASTTAARPNERISLQTLDFNRSGSISQSFGPSYTFAFDLVTDAEVVARVRAAAPDFSTGDQLRFDEHFIDFPSSGPKRTNLFTLDVDVTGVRISGLGGPALPILTDQKFSYGPGIGNPASPGSLIVPVVEVQYGAPDLNLPARKDNPSTLVDESYRGIVQANAIVEDPVRGPGVQTTIGPSTRTGASFLAFGASDPQDPDVVKSGVDLDGLVTLATGLPFGVRFSLGKGPVTVLSIEGNAIDMDLTFNHSFAQELKFFPGLQVDLQFNQPTSVETASGQVVSMTSTGPLPVGTEIHLLHPGSDLVVTPVYSLDPYFINNLLLLLDYAIEADYLNLELGGLLLSGTFSALGLPDSFSLAHFEAQVARFGPAVVDPRAFAPLAFDPIEGEPFTITAVPEPASYVCMLIGIAMLLVLRKRRPSSEDPRSRHR